MREDVTDIIATSTDNSKQFWTYESAPCTVVLHYPNPPTLDTSYLSSSFSSVFNFGLVSIRCFTRYLDMP